MLLEVDHHLMPLTSRDIEKLQSLYRRLLSPRPPPINYPPPEEPSKHPANFSPAKSLSSGAPAAFPQSQGPSKGPPTQDLENPDGGEPRRDRNLGIEFLALQIQLNRALNRIERIARQLAELDGRYRELYTQIQSDSRFVSSVSAEVASLKYNVSLLQRGGIGAGFSILGAITSGVSRGFEAAAQTKAIGERIERGYIKFGTDADRQRFAMEQTWRITLLHFGIRI